MEWKVSFICKFLNVFLCVEYLGLKYDPKIQNRLNVNDQLKHFVNTKRFKKLYVKVPIFYTPYLEKN